MSFSPMNLGWKKLITTGKKTLVKEITFNKNSREGVHSENAVWEKGRKGWRGKSNSLSPSPTET